MTFQSAGKCQARSYVSQHLCNAVHGSANRSAAPSAPRNRTYCSIATKGWSIASVQLSTLLVLLFASVNARPASAAEPEKIAIKDDFEAGTRRWSPTDETKWKIEKLEGGNHVYHLLGVSKYQPPHRSPHSISLLKDVVVTDFELTAKVQTLQTSRGHRDMCVIFGYQDPANFYYVHLGQATDDHANQIFVVDNAPRVKISEKTNTGTPWKDATWHNVKIVRRVQDGLIEIYFDDMSRPAMVAHDKRFAWGQIGLGSFDDMGLWDDVSLVGVKHAANK